MKDREKVVKKLEELLEQSQFNDSVGWNPDCDTETLEDALALLKAQEPETSDVPKPDSDIGCWYDITHNYTLEQVVSALKVQEPRVVTWDELIATDHVYIETNKDGQKYIVPGIVTIVRDTAVIVSVRIGTRLIDGTIDKDDYGKHFRCWTSRPTDAQREATPWEP